MKLTQKATYLPAPEGIHDAVCVDVVELYGVETKFGTKDMLRLVWEIGEKMEDGRPFLAFARYTASINEKSNFYKALKGWFGRGPKGEFDTEALIGRQCTLVIQHNESNGDTFANVTAIMKKRPSAIEPSGNYVRVKDREESNGGGSKSATKPPPEDPDWVPGDDPELDDDSSIPF